MTVFRDLTMAQVLVIAALAAVTTLLIIYLA